MTQKIYRKDMEKRQVKLKENLEKDMTQKIYRKDMETTQGNFMEKTIPHSKKRTKEILQICMKLLKKVL